MFHAPHPAFGIREATETGIEIPEIRDRQYIPADGFIRDRDTGALAPGQVGLQPFNTDERKLEAELLDTLNRKSDFTFVNLCVGMSTRDIYDFLTLKDIVRDRIAQEEIRRARDVQQERLKESMPRRLQTRDAFNQRYLHLLNVEGLIDVEAWLLPPSLLLISPRRSAPRHGNGSICPRPRRKAWHCGHV